MLGFVQAPYPGSEAWLLNTVATVGPTTIGFNVMRSFMNYKSGIYSESSCTTSSSNYLGGHAVTVIGYGTSGSTAYWLIRNSWGNTWGESGYFKMARNANNMCGLATYATYPTI